MSTDPLVDEQDGRFYVAESTVSGAGSGLFAKVALREGDRLAVVGARVRRESVSDRCTHFADAHKFRAGDHLVIPMGFAGMVNHSTSPNLEKVVEGEALYLRALRDIAAGEELFFCYSEYARERFGLR